MAKQKKNQRIERLVDKKVEEGAADAFPLAEERVVPEEMSPWPNRRERDENPEAEFIEAVQAAAAAARGIQKEFGQSRSRLSPGQVVLLENLTRLQQSLQGPEQQLDAGSYSRPFPPLTNKQW